MSRTNASHYRQLPASAHVMNFILLVSVLLMLWWTEYAYDGNARLVSSVVTAVNINSIPQFHNP